MIKTSPHKKTKCPVCRGGLPDYGSDKGTIPEPGELSFCSNCGTVLEFDTTLSLMRINPQKLEQLKNTPNIEWLKIVRYQNIYRQIKK